MWAWWAEQQLLWGCGDASVRLLHPTSPGEWEAAPVATAFRPNSLLQILATLLFWLESLQVDGGSVASWVELVKDVLWVLEQLPEVACS